MDATSNGMNRQIERQGKTTGRWQRYNLIVDGVDVGLVRRTISVGCDRLAGPTRMDGWDAGMKISMTQADAEAHLITRAIRFGHLNQEEA